MSWSSGQRSVLLAGTAGLLIGASVVFILMKTPAPEQLRPVRHAEVRTLFYSNIELDPHGACDAVFPVERTITFDSFNHAADAEQRGATVLTQLFAGPTAEEVSQGFSSFFSAETAGLLRKLRIHEGNEQTAYIDLHDMRYSLSGANSSCGSLSFFAQLEHTMRATVGVSQIRYAFEGNPEMFYNWMQIGCGAAEKLCDPEPFR